MRPRAVLRIARWEATAGAGGIDRRTALLALAALVALAALAALAPLVAGSGAAPDAGIYRVGVERSSPYYGPVAGDVRFAVVDREAPFDARGLDLVIRGRTVRARDTAKGRAAVAALAEATERYNDRLMRREDDRAAAFPVEVRLRYVERDVGLLVRRAGGGGGGGSGDGDGGDGGDGAGSGGDGRGETPAGGGGGTAGGDGEADGGIPSIGGSGALFGRTAGSPSEVSPPFPFVSLVLAFAFVIPMNFVIQAYASSVLHERGNRRGELMLVAPVSRGDIVAGKTLPYFAAMVAIAGATALAIGGGAVSLLAVVPIALLFLACAFVGALLARSHKELTFVLVAVSVAVTTYAFVPAIFSQVHPIAAISPLSLVVRELEEAAISPATVAFSTGPVYLAAGVLFALGLGMYRGEDLFARRPLPAKLLDALAGPIRGRHTAAVMSVLSIPFVFLAELLAVAVLFVLPFGVALPVLLAIVAAIEEIAKSLHVYAGFERARYDRSLRAAAAVGAASGAGFFVCEKFAAVAQLVGLLDLDLGRAAFELGAGTGGGSGPVLAFLLLAPLALHAVTASLSAVGASRGRDSYAAALAAAIVVHVAYNLWVVWTLG